MSHCFRIVDIKTIVWFHRNSNNFSEDSLPPIMEIDVWVESATGTFQDSMKLIINWLNDIFIRACRGCGTIESRIIGNKVNAMTKQEIESIDIASFMYKFVFEMSQLIVDEVLTLSRKDLGLGNPDKLSTEDAAVICMKRFHFWFCSYTHVISYEHIFNKTLWVIDIFEEALLKFSISEICSFRNIVVRVDIFIFGFRYPALELLCTINGHCV